jgi:glycosyltransferase involved in cell wall biosynthesis
MRVGLVVPGFSADDTDWCIPALRDLALALAAQDDVRVFALRYPYRSGEYAVGGTRVTSFGGADRRGGRTLGVWARALAGMAVAHRTRRFDILHAFWATESGLLAALAGRALAIPTLVSLAGGELVAFRDINYGDQRSRWERLKVGTALRLATAVTAGSNLLLALAERHVAPGRLYRAPLGVDAERFRPSAATASCRLVHVGSLIPVKDQATLLRAFALLRRQARHTTLSIVGDGPLQPDLARLAHQLGLADSVVLGGAMDHGQLPSVYAGAAAFVLSSRYEAQGMAALEAAACRVPIAGTRVGVLPEITPHVAPARSAEQLAEAVAVALEQPRFDQHERVLNEFGLGPCTDRFRALYARVVAGRPKGFP